MLMKEIMNNLVLLIKNYQNPDQIKILKLIQVRQCLTKVLEASIQMILMQILIVLDQISQKLRNLVAMLLSKKSKKLKVVHIVQKLIKINKENNWEKSQVRYKILISRFILKNNEKIFWNISTNYKVLY